MPCVRALHSASLIPTVRSSPHPAIHSSLLAPPAPSQTRARAPQGPLCRQHDALFLKSARFAGVAFPAMGAPETLRRHFAGGALPPDALAFLE